MTIEQVLALKPGQRAKLSRAELARAVSVLASAGNKRLRRIEKAGLTKSSNAYQAIARSGGDFSVKNKDITELDNEFERLKKFFAPDTKTSTVGGTKKSIQRRKKAVEGWMADQGLTDYYKWSKSKQNKFWELVDSPEMQKVIEQYYGNYKGKQAINIAYNEFVQQEKDVRKYSRELLKTMPGDQNKKLRRQMIQMERENLTRRSLSRFQGIAQSIYEAQQEMEAEEEEDLEAYMTARYSTVE